MNINDKRTDIEAVITSYNQGSMILEAVQSLCNQTLIPEKIIIVDDGSTDEYSLNILNEIEKKYGFTNSGSDTLSRKWWCIICKKCRN